MKRPAIPILLSLMIVAALLPLGACGGGGAASTTAASSSSTTASTISGTSSSTTTAAPPASSSTTTTALREIIPGVPTLLYTNSNYGFSLERPETSMLETTGFEGFLPLTQSSVVAIVLPSSLFKGTNLVEAGVYVGVSSSVSVTSKWNVPVADSGEVAAGTSTINGTTFAIFTSTGAAAGNIYEERVYRTLHKGIVVEIVELLHSGELANYPKGSVVQFDKVKFGGYLEVIVDTFAFDS